MILQGSSNITLTLFNLFLKNTPIPGHQGPPHLLFSTCWHNLSWTAKWPLSHLPTPSECTAGGRRGCLVCLHFKHLLPPHRRGAWLVERKKARGRGSERVSTSPHGWLISPAIRRKKEMEKGLFHFLWQWTQGGLETGRGARMGKSTETTPLFICRSGSLISRITDGAMMARSSWLCSFW